MQVMKLTTWLEADEAMKVIELLDTLREALIEEHGEGIKEMLRESMQSPEVQTDSEQQKELPLG